MTAVTMALTPLLATLGRNLASRLQIAQAAEPELTVRPPADQAQAIVVGYGRVGKVVCSLLERHGVKYIALDHAAAGVTRDRRDGHAVYYGDATEPGFLEACGLLQATGVIITIHSRDEIDRVVDRVRAIRPDVLVVSRARDEEHARHLYAIGATDAVPETIEASLQLSEAALVGLGVAAGPVIASIHERRDAIRDSLREAARKAGQQEIHSVRRSKQRSEP
jgi:CPA2 family monovalent cation:H+ antiporter-2